jgi:formylglycine-generating enzyme required for sulfatase activity
VPDGLLVMKHPVTNHQWLQFMDDGGYEQRSLWANEGDWDWKTRVGRRHPTNWASSADADAGCDADAGRGGGENGNEWVYRTLFHNLSLSDASNVPVFVSQAEASAYCTWQGSR